MESSEANKSHQNYELLIRVDEKLLNLSREVREMSLNVNGRISALDVAKLDKEEATRLLNDAEKIHKDHEDRIRIVEVAVNKIDTRIKTWGTVVAVGLAILQIFLHFIK